MLSGWLLALSVAASPGQCATCGPMGGGMEFSPGMASGSFVAGAGAFSNPYDAVSAGGGGGGDQLYPFDSPEPWLHGYFQELPAHSGYASFRPHNYKHVLSQMQLAGRWGMNPVMGYSHQWYHRYRQRSGMHPNFGTGSASLEQPSFGHVAQNQAPGDWSTPSNAAPRSASGNQGGSLQQAALQQGYTGTPIPGITTPYYQRAAQPAASVGTASAEYLERMDKLQKQIEEQTFQMQLMQQQLQAQDKSQLSEWQQPNHMKFQSNSQAREPRQLQQFAATPAQSYQELPPPAAFQQPAYVRQTQSAPVPQGYPQTQPMYQPAPQYQNAPAQAAPQGYGTQPTYQPQGNAAPSNPIMTVPPQGAAMQIPQGQAYFSSPQNSAPAYAASPQQQPIAGTHAVWQQAEQPAASAYNGRQYGAAAVPQQFAPQQQLVPQQPQYQQLQYTQPGAYPQPGYQQQPAYQAMPAGQVPYYQ